MCNRQYSSHQQNSNPVLSSTGPNSKFSLSHTSAVKGKNIKFSVKQLTSGFSGGISLSWHSPCSLLQHSSSPLRLEYRCTQVEEPSEARRIYTRSLKPFVLRNHLQCKKLGLPKLLFMWGIFTDIYHIRNENNF